MDIAFRSVAMPGESANGDAAVVRHDQGATLFSVVDGLGHGPKAHEASSRVLDVVHNANLTASLEDLMQKIHRALVGTRGAAATVCLVQGNEIQACGIGNVELRTSHVQLPFMLSPGILGKQLKAIRTVGGTLAAKSRVVLFSDGLSGRFAISDYDHLSAEETCDMLIQKHARGQDDVTVLVADAGGRSGTRK